MRPILAVLAVLLAVPASAQTPVSVVGPGTRVRVFLSSDELPREGVQFVGALRSVGDTLVIATDGGSVVRVLPRDLAGFDVSAGRRPFPYWLPVVSAAVGFGAAYALVPALPASNCDGAPSCPEGPNNFEYAVLVAGPMLGAAAGAYLGSRLASERWVPVGRLAMTVRGLSWAVRL